MTTGVVAVSVGTGSGVAVGRTVGGALVGLGVSVTTGSALA
jgi:hypothetical protein